jgi:ferredoxin-type protein NapF
MDPRRRRFLRGAISELGKPVEPPPRPPWALAEAAFLERCTRCGECTRACPRELIAAGDGGYPVVSFAKQGCTLCGDCERACAPRALERGRGAAWEWKAVVDGRCVVVQRIECRICADACEAGAISMAPGSGGIDEPTVSREACTGCGACVAPCPTTAIRLI